MIAFDLDSKSVKLAEIKNGFEFVSPGLTLLITYFRSVSVFQTTCIFLNYLLVV